MMDKDRPASWTTRRAALALAGASGLALIVGCDPRQAMYFLQPFDAQVAPIGPNLKGKTIAIVPTALAGALADAPGADREIAKELGKLIKENVRRTKLVPAREVEAWIEANPNWTDPAEIGRALEADYVIVLEFERFRIQDPSSPAMFLGESSVHLQAVELKAPEGEDGRPDEEAPRESSIAYNETVQTAFPSRGPLPADDKVNPTTFKSRFVKVCTTELSWHFVPHANGDDIHDARF